MRKKIIPVLGIAVLAGGSLGGCSGFLRIEDTANGQVYYARTSSFERAAATGAVLFTDVADGASVTLPGSRVKRISKDEFEAALAGSEAPD